MSDLAIETNRLTKTFGTLIAVNAVNLSVKQGEIYGFLGLNGAGKTTTIRALLGMIRPTDGQIKVLGQPVGHNGIGPWDRVGHLVEKPSAYPELTVRENLDITRRLHGIGDPQATSRVIQQLALDAYADRKAGQLSTGNLQRLGLARALLHQPQLLILDEPSNGLDPAGVVEIRQLLASLAREEGITIFMSSHILTEVERLATRVGVIHQGCLIEELDRDKLERLRARRLEVKTRNLHAAKICLQNAGYQPRIQDETIFLESDRAVEHPEFIAQILVNAGVPPSRLVVEQQDLEEHFLLITGGTK